MGPKKAKNAKGRVLAIGGSDPGAGAGIQADLKTISALGGYALTALTAVTVQDTKGVRQIFQVPAKVVEAQAKAVLADLGADAVKTGMLGTAETVRAVASLLAGPAKRLPAVIDPVLVSTSGAVLLEPGALKLFRSRIVPRATLITPNIPEAEALTGLACATLDDRRRAAEALLAMGAGAVLLKGGHARGSTVIDLLVTPDGETLFEGPRLKTRHTHGTGCTLASAIATGLALGWPLIEAVGEGWAYTAEAIRHAPGLGKGHGPLGHFWSGR
ncbi:MAG TPA: bifunctional hydroxymethylpyrimidine kinase/phosphomethylpyrimidine kinase [Caulobacteraceae bacterium]|jgi:hydroxymethylpyrimidine/phosphomethylpyrimidine kinase|nr:bifunctional hydroxymethylpyrimidine kinase/phosphomethylpyrimidine kinase [Caulobacteraceae bacterium]